MFSRHCRLAATTSALLVCLASLASADQIVMKDGDRITGAVVKKDGDTITVQSKHFGLVTFRWADVASVRSDQELTVVLNGEQTARGPVRLEDGRVQVGESQTPVPAADVIALRNDAEQKTYERFLRPGLLDLWTITGSLNIAGTRGNAETSTLTTPIQFGRATRTSRTMAYFNSIRSSATVNNMSGETARAIRGGWGYSRNLNKRLFANGFNDYEFDKFQALDLRVVLGGGLGYQVWTHERGRLALVGGAAWNREKFAPATRPAFTRNSAEGYWGNEFSYKLNSRTNLVQGFRMFNNLTNTGEYRVNFDLGATTQLLKWLTWNISLSDRYLSNPVPGRRTNDFLYSTGFGFAFAR